MERPIDALKKVLACPSCKSREQLKWLDDAIQCLRCRLSYPMEDGIPVMLVEEARKLDETNSPL